MINRYNQLPALARVPLKFGAVAALLNCALMFLLFKAERHPSLIPPYLDSRILVFLVFIYFALREYKVVYNNGILHFWEGLFMGISVYLTVGILGAFFILIISKYDASFVSMYIQNVVEGIEGAREEMLNGPQKVKMTEEEFDNLLDGLKQTTAAGLAIDYFIKSCIIGFLIPLVYSVIFRKTDN